MTSLKTGPDMVADAERLFAVLKNGGIAIIPADVGYAIVTCDENSLERIFKAKGRAAHKRHAIIGNMDIHHDLHITKPQSEEIIKTLVEVYGLPMGTICKFKKDHPNLKRFSPFTMEASTVDDTIDVLVNAGKFVDTLTALAWKNGYPIMGSSANLSTMGMKYRYEDIEQPIRDLADDFVDYGLAKYHIFGRASTMINFEDLTVVRFGAAYQTIHCLFKKYFGVVLPEDPGLGALRDGHLHVPPPIVRPASNSENVFKTVNGNGGVASSTAKIVA